MIICKFNFIIGNIKILNRKDFALVQEKKLIFFVFHLVMKIYVILDLKIVLDIIKMQIVHRLNMLLLGMNFTWRLLMLLNNYV